MSRYRVNREAPRHYVEHRTEDETSWCGPLIMSSGHSRAEELPEPVICIACGDFCRGVELVWVETVRKLEALMDRQERAHDVKQAVLDKLRRAGVDVAALPVPVKAKRARRAVQASLFGCDETAEQRRAADRFDEERER